MPFCYYSIEMKQRNRCNLQAYKMDYDYVYLYHTSQSYSHCFQSVIVILVPKMEIFAVLMTLICNVR